MASPTMPITTVTVAPTATIVFEAQVWGANSATLQIDNLDASQTFSGVIQRKMREESAWADSTLGDFEAVGPLAAVVADLDVSGTGFIRLVGTMSGAGGDVAWSLRAG